MEKIKWLHCKASSSFHRIRFLSLFNASFSSLIFLHSISFFPFLLFFCDFVLSFISKIEVSFFFFLSIVIRFAFFFFSLIKLPVQSCHFFFNFTLQKILHVFFFRSFAFLVFHFIFLKYFLHFFLFHNRSFIIFVLLSFSRTFLHSFWLNSWLPFFSFRLVFLIFLIFYLFIYSST